MTQDKFPIIESSWSDLKTEFRTIVFPTSEDTIKEQEEARIFRQKIGGVISKLTDHFVEDIKEIKMSNEADLLFWKNFFLKLKNSSLNLSETVNSKLMKLKDQLGIK
jgi:hypothetical protein